MSCQRRFPKTHVHNGKLVKSSRLWWSVDEGSQSSDSAKKRKANGKKRCQKKPGSQSSTAEMPGFVKTYREKAEEEKLRILK